jgi:hypothetical protein
VRIESEQLYNIGSYLRSAADIDGFVKNSADTLVDEKGSPVAAVLITFEGMSCGDSSDGSNNDDPTPDGNYE